MAKGGGRGRRSYVRDARGRFASTPGGGAAKKAAKGRSVSTGRPQPRTFRQRQQASLDRRPGQGGYLGKATREAKAKLRASKAKLKASATPQQRAAVTRARIRAEGASPVTKMRRTAPTGALKGVKVTRAQGRRAKPGQAQPVAPVKPQQQGSTFARMATIGRKRVRLTGRLINMNAREPYQFTPPPKNQKNPYYPFSVKDSRNIDQAKKILESMGVKVYPRDWSGDTAVARGRLGQNAIFLNPNSQYWENPAKRSREMRRSGFSSSSSPLSLLFHEIGHNRHKGGAALWYLSGEAGNWNKGIVPNSMWAKSIAPAKAKQESPLGRIKLGKKLSALARRVSGYAATNPVEFVAEAYAGLRTGRKYDREVMAAYREAMGLPAKPPARMRSRLPRRRKPAS